MRVGLEFRLFSYAARGPRIGSLRILVTGGSGFVGRHLLSLLRSEGHECRFTSTRETLDPLGVILRLPDERGALDILQAFQPEAVIHLAGVAFVPEAEGDPIRAAEVNVEGTLGLLRALHRFDGTGKVRWVHVSTSQVYDSRAGERLDEEAPLFPSNAYASTKLAAEVLVRMYASAEGRAAIIFRPFNHIGPGQREAFAVSSFARQVVKLERSLAEGTRSAQESVLEVGDLQVRRDYCDVRDIVKAYSAAAQGQLPQGTYNLASGVATPLSWVVDLLRQLSPQPFQVRVRQERSRSGEALTLSGNAGKIRSACGWKAEIPLEASVREVLEWWRRCEHV